MHGKYTSIAKAAAVGFALCLGFPQIAEAQQLIIRLGHVMPPNHFENEAMNKLAALVGQRSNGQIEIKVFPASQLGSEREQTEQVDSGALECHSSGGAIQNYAPALGAWSLPFLFRDADHYNKVMDGPIGDRFRQMLSERSNIRLLAFYPNGERMFFSNRRPISRLADFRGVKIRVDDQPVSAQIWRALGANPVPLAFAELYTALQTGVVDAGENPPINISRMKFFEVAKFVTTTRHSLTTMALMCNETWWKTLPDASRTLLTQAIQEILPMRRAASWAADREAIEELRKAGATITELQNREEFERALLPLYEEFGRRTNSADIIQQIRETR